MEITVSQLDGLLNLIKNKSIAVLLHAQNYHDIWKWSREPVIMIRTAIDKWDGDVVHWALESIIPMLDPNNNNNSTDNHAWPGITEVVDKFLNQKAC